ncbi:Chromatin structure remodeling complex protein sfh1 [Savitreella phatthalungensis]
MAQYLSSYTSRLATGSTALITPANRAEWLQAGDREHARERGDRNTRPRPSYRDTSSMSPPPSESNETANEADKADGRQEPTYDGRGYVVALPEGTAKLQYRPKSWVRIRSDHVLERAAETPENLIPIRLDMDLPGNVHLKDTFLWNLNEELVTPTEFALNLVQDLALPPGYVQDIARDVRKQLEEYAPVANVQFPGTRPVMATVEVEMHLARHLVTDKFEWNLNDMSGIEEFVRATCRDMGLFGEFVPAISCAVREQLIRVKKELADQYQAGKANLYGDEEDPGVRNPSGNNASTGTGTDDWTPAIELLSKEDIDKRDAERERVMRRLRRESSRFGTKKRKLAEDELIAAGGMPEHERLRWKCAWCRVPGTDAWQIKGNKRQYCGRCFDSIPPQQALPQDWRKGMYSTRNAVNTR